MLSAGKSSYDEILKLYRLGKGQTSVSSTDQAATNYHTPLLQIFYYKHLILTHICIK